MRAGNGKEIGMSEKIVLYGAGKEGKDLVRRIGIFQDEIKIMGFVDSFKKGSYCGYPILSLDELQKIKADIIITVRDQTVMKEIYDGLLGYRAGRIYWHYAHREFSYADTYEDFLREECIHLKDLAREKGILSHVEMHISDYCNLNCRGCTHFSPIFERRLPDTAKRIEDVRRLSEKVGVILQFFIMGGEPLLNPEITRYVERIREILPDTDIWVVTNGLLIPTVGEEVLKCMRENNISVSISEYGPTHRMADQIIERLRGAGLHYSIRPYDIKQKFIKPLSLTADSKYKKRCISEGCINIWEGKIARCPTLMYIDKFNERFGTALPDDGIYDLDGCPEGSELLGLLQQEVPLCRHCVENEIEWSCCGTRASLSDFAVED